MKHRTRIAAALLIILLPLSIAASVAWGASSQIAPQRALHILAGASASPAEYSIIMNYRLPRALIAALVGAALAVAGCALQGLFNNPLAEPGVLGVSSGGALGAVAMISLGVQGVWAIPMAAFVGAMITAAAVFVIATSHGRTPLATLLLAGVALNALLGAAVSLVLSQHLGSFDATQQIINWLMGDLESRTWLQVRVALGPILIGAVCLQLMARDLNSISLGEETAASLGVRVQRVKIEVLALVSLVTGVAVAVSGVLSFVGLIVPQLLRLFIGPDHRRLLPLSALSGAVFLTLMDLISRVIIRPQDIRIGILTSLIGGPFFLLLLVVNRRKGRLV